MPSSNSSLPAPSTSPALSRRERWLFSLGSWLVTRLTGLLIASWRMKGIRGEEHIAELRGSRDPVILAFWHNRLLPCGGYILRRLVREDVPVVVFASLSRDGELIARVSSGLGFGSIRGSSTRGGLQGLRQLRRVLSGRRSSVILAPDGSQGPVYEAKPGIMVLARVAGVPIIPLAAAADRSWRLRSWDRLIIPRPFARVTLAIGRPITIPQGLASAEIRIRARELGDELKALVDQAEAGVRDL